MPDVLDFLILRQTYDQSISRNWRPGGLGGYIFSQTPEFNPKLFNLDMVVDGSTFGALSFLWCSWRTLLWGKTSIAVCKITAVSRRIIAA